MSTTEQLVMLSYHSNSTYFQSLRDRSRVVHRSDSACVFTKRSVVKMQALRNRVESLESM